jgi:hypothetical protein
MTDKETLMLVCRDSRDLKLLSRFCELKSENRVVVASDDLLVQSVARLKPWVDELCFIEDMESYYVVASEVIQILQVVNQWLKSLADEKKGVPGELLFWIKFAEGGMTTQRIQDLLLLIRSYQHLLREHDVRCLIIARCTGHSWENGIIVDTARRMGISVEEICPFFDRIRDKLGITTVWRTVRPALVQLMFYLHILRTRIRTRPRFSSFPKRYPEIVFQLGSSARKHVENIAPLMHEFRRRGKYQPIALCWQASDGAAQIRREGLQADELGAWFPLSRLPQIMQQARQTWKSARKRKGEFNQSSSISYNGIQLGPHLWPSVEYFLQKEIIKRLVLKTSAERYFTEHHPVGMKLWGAGILEFGAICHAIANRAKEVLTFSWDWGGVVQPYFENKCDLYLAAGELDRSRFINQSISSEQITVAGLARYDHLASFTKDNSPLNSRKILNLPLQAKFYLFFATSNIVRGSISLREQFILADALIGFFKDHPDCVLVIKPHPEDYSGVTERLTIHSEATNIKIVNSKMLPYHCINAVDAVVTKFSMVGIETMLLGKPVISVILDNERRWQGIYGNIADCFYDIQDLVNFLDLIIRNPEEKERWEQEQQRVRRKFLSQKFAKVDKSGAEIMADAIEKRLLVRAQSARA